MSEIDDLIARFDPALGNTHKELSFTLENGTDILKQWFSQVSLERYPDGLIITEAEPLAAYICSMIGMAVPQMKREQLIEFINQELAQQGAFHVSKDVGLFIACR